MHDVIVDHSSFSWANEEVAAMYDTKNVTVQWSILTEGLYNAGHAKGVRSYVGVWGGQNATYHHNLITNAVSRTVRFNGARAHDTIALINYRNNVIYNWGSSNAAYGGEVEITNGKSEVNIVNNYYKPGPATSTTLKFVQASYTASLAKGIGRWYLSGNIMEGNTAMTNDNSLGLDLNALPAEERANARSLTPFPVSEMLPQQNAESAYELVLANAGAGFPMRDAVDARIVNETRTKTATGMGSYGKPGIIDTPSAVGGWPVYNSAAPSADADHDGMADAWEAANGLDAADAEDRNILGSNGYTMLEKYLNGLVVNSALPLKLLSFTASRDANRVTFLWSTANAINTNKFELERSADGVSYTSISSIKALNVSGINNYNYKDEQPLNGSSFYRLKIIDKDGKVSYSQTIAFNTKQKDTFSVSPNPVVNNITISHITANFNTQIKIYTVDGKLRSTYKVNDGATQTSIDASRLLPGLYTIVFINNNNKTVHQFLKQ